MAYRLLLPCLKIASLKQYQRELYYFQYVSVFLIDNDAEYNSALMEELNNLTVKVNKKPKARITDLEAFIKLSSRVFRGSLIKPGKSILLDEWSKILVKVAKTGESRDIH